MDISIQDKLIRYEKWLSREPVERPMLGLLWELDIRPLPEFIEKVGEGQRILPEDLKPQFFLPYIEKWLQRVSQLRMDIFHSFSPGFGIPWIEAMLGCPIIAGKDSIWPIPIMENIDESASFVIDAENPWLIVLVQLLQDMVDLSDGRFPISLPPLHSPLDILGMICGEKKLFLDLIENPVDIKRALKGLTEVYFQIHDFLFEYIPVFNGGYVTRLKMWAPDKAITPQNEYGSMISAEMYNNFALPIDRRITEYYPFHSFHLHGSAFHQVELLLTLDKLSAIQITQEHDAGGPSLENMLPVYRRVLDSKPLIIVVPDIGTAEKCMEGLPPEGLCILIMEAAYELDRSYDDWLISTCSN